MRIALVTEGDAEFAAIPKILPQLERATAHQIIKPLKATIQPDASAAVVARQAKGAILIAAAKGADLVVVVLDREKRVECPSLLATAVEAAISAVCAGVTVKVVYKDRAFENWLVADMDALKKQPARFAVTPARRKKVEPNKSDKIDALVLLKEMATGPSYSKVVDGVKICSHMHVGKAAKHSRSFRHFMHVLGCLDDAGCRA